MEVQILVALISGLMAYIIGRQNAINGYNHEVGLRIWKARRMYYKEVFDLSRIVPKSPNRLNELKKSELNDFNEKLRKWYFDGGGIFLSKSSMDQYVELKGFLDDYLDSDDELISDKVEYDRIRLKISRLRGELTKDLLSRKRFQFKTGN